MDNPFPGAGQTALTTATGEVVYTPPADYVPPAPGESPREKALARSAAEQRPPVPPPPSGEEINDALYNSTRYTGNPPQTHVLPPPVADLDADNFAFAKAIIARWSSGVTLWVARQLNLASWEVRDNLSAIRLRLAQHLTRIFSGRDQIQYTAGDGRAIQPSSLRGMMRIALQGAQPLNEAGAPAEIIASAGGSGLSTSAPAYGIWKNNWQQNATAWMQKRQALDWAVVPEIVAGLPLISRALEAGVQKWSAMTVEIRRWYGPTARFVYDRKEVQSILYERDPAYRSAGEDQREWPRGFGVEGSGVAPDMIVYAWDGWREELSGSNRVACYALGMKLSPDEVQQLCGDMGVIPDLPLKDKIIALADSWATYATETNVSLMMEIARDAERKGLASHKSLRALEDAAVTYGAGGFFSDLWKGIKRLAGHVVKWFNAIGREIGRFLQVLGREVKRWARIPIIGDLFIVATGIEFVFAIVLPNIGKMLQTGKSSAFVMEEVGFGIARLLDRAGRALAMITPFLPPPFQLAAAAIAAISIVAGGLIANLMTLEERREAHKTYYEDRQKEYDDYIKSINGGAGQNAANNLEATNAAANAAYDTSMDLMQREGVLGEAMLNASKDLATRGVAGISKIALAAGAALALGFVGYMVTRKA